MVIAGADAVKPPQSFTPASLLGQLKDARVTGQGRMTGKQGVSKHEAILGTIRRILERLP